MKDGLNVQSSLKRSMSKLIGERMLSKQETCYLILELTLASWSHNFIKINLLCDSSMLEIDELYYNNALPTKLSIIDACAEIMDKNV